MKRFIAVIFIAIALFFLFTTARDFLTKQWVTREIEKSRDQLADISASDYHPLSSLQSNNQLEVRNIHSYAQAKFQGMALVGAANAPLLFFSDSKLGYQHILLDRNADVSLAIYAKGGVTPIGDYLITREGYYSFLLDGNPDLIPYEPYAVNTPITESTIKKLYEESQYYDYGVRNENNRFLYRSYIHYFYRQGTWIAVEVDFDLEHILGRKTEPFGSHKGIKEFTRVFPKDYDDKEQSALFFDGRVNITLDHFLKEDYHKATSPKLGSPTGGSRPEYWSGKSYYTFEFDGKIIKFYVPTGYNGRLSLHGDKALNFVTFLFNLNGYGRQIGMVISLKPDISGQ